MMANAAQTTSFLRERLQPVVEPEPAVVRQLIAELDSKQFAVRQRASKQLSQMGRLAEPALRAALVKSSSAEARQRLEALLAAPPALAPTADVLRHLRAIQVLEWINTVDTQQILRTVATGAALAIETQEASASLERLLERLAKSP